MIKKILLAVLMLGMIGVGTGLYLWNKPHKTVDDEQGIEITAKDLQISYNSDENAANASYLNKVITVSGVVSEQEENQDGGLMIVLATNDPIAGVQCAMREKGVTVAKGEKVTIKGFCSGNSITGVSLTDCIVNP